MALNPDVNYTNFVSHFDKFIIFILTANNLPAIQLTILSSHLMFQSFRLRTVCECGSEKNPENHEGAWERL